jgi:hypothetical protein
VSSMSTVLTPLQTSPRNGERLKKLIFVLLLPFRFGEGGWEGEVCRIHVKLALKISSQKTCVEDYSIAIARSLIQVMSSKIT